MSDYEKMVYTFERDSLKRFLVHTVIYKSTRNANPGDTDLNNQCIDKAGFDVNSREREVLCDMIEKFGVYMKDFRIELAQKRLTGFSKVMKYAHDKSEKFIDSMCSPTTDC